MFYSTHMIFADIVYKSLKVNYNFKIKKSSFKYGNIKPDMSRMIISYPQHTKEDSLEFVIDQIDSLISEVQYLQQMRRREFARRLGVINHYIADYFCIAHNKNIMDEGLISHILYERKMDKFMKKNNNKQ